MEKTPIIPSAPEGKFKLSQLKPNPNLSGISKTQTESHIQVTYQNRFALYDDTQNISTPIIQEKTIKTDIKVPKLGVMLVGLGGNNGSTFTAGILANKKQLTWATRQGESKANFYGSFTQSATTHVGFKFDEQNGTLTDVFKPIKELLPMASPIDFEVSGWDISSANLYEAVKRAHVLEPTLIEQLKGDLENIKPMKAVLNPDFIAANQADRCDNVRQGTNEELIEFLREDIRAVKERCDKVVLLWTANTEMYLLPEINALDDLEDRIKNNIPLPASVLYCIAAIKEGIIYLNGSP